MTSLSCLIASCLFISLDFSEHAAWALRQSEMAGMGWHGAPLKPLSWFDKFKLLFPEWIPWWVRPHGLDLKQREVSYLMEVIDQSSSDEGFCTLVKHFSKGKCTPTMTCDECVDERMNEVIADHKEEMKLLRKKRRKKEDKPTAVIVLGGVGSGKTTFVKTRLDLELGKDYRNFWKTALALNADDLRSDLLGGYEVYSAYFTQAYFKETERSKAGPSQRVFQAGNRLRRAVQNDALEQQVNLIADSLTLPVFVAEEFKKTCKVKVFYIEIPGANWSQKVQTASEHVKHRMARGGALRSGLGGADPEESQLRAGAPAGWFRGPMLSAASGRLSPLQAAGVKGWNR
ncbi:unnamed protein product [Durusdinium trenchii]|uniref:Zeta toxin domain-containing protein n=1 Tax=Durusdinium trenchii TaxID=1381693 RepID=A0ABP0J1L6_9DINO